MLALLCTGANVNEEGADELTSAPFLPLHMQLWKNQESLCALDFRIDRLMKRLLQPLKLRWDGSQLCSYYIHFSRSCSHVDKARGCLKMKHTETLKRHQTGTC